MFYPGFYCPSSANLRQGAASNSLFGRENSLFGKNNSLFCQENSLFHCEGILLQAFEFARWLERESQKKADGDCRTRLRAVNFPNLEMYYLTVIPVDNALQRVLYDGAVAICVGIDFGAISSTTRLPDHAARSIV